MEVSELRIGNFIMHNGIEDKVDLSLFSGIEIFDTENLLSPIPLTEEWLVRFGFEKRKFSYLYGYGNFLYDYRLKLWTWYGIQLHDYLITYVHQLQNLYFALTGQELEISE